jgi:hypothetical protein
MENLCFQIAKQKYIKNNKDKLGKEKTYTSKGDQNENSPCKT